MLDGYLRLLKVNGIGTSIILCYKAESFLGGVGEGTAVFLKLNTIHNVFIYIL